MLRCYQIRTYSAIAQTSRNGLSFHSFVLQVTPIVDETIRQLTVTPSKSIIAGWHFYSAVAASEGGVPLLTSTFTAPDLKITVLLKKYSKTDPIHRLLIHIISCFLVCTQIIVGSEIQGPHIVHLHIFCSYPHPPIHERSHKWKYSMLANYLVLHLCVGSKNTQSDSGEVHSSYFAGFIARPAPPPGASIVKCRLPGTQVSKLKKSQLVFIQSIGTLSQRPSRYKTRCCPKLIWPIFPNQRKHLSAWQNLAVMSRRRNCFVTLVMQWRHSYSVHSANMDRCPWWIWQICSCKSSHAKKNPSGNGHFHSILWNKHVKIDGF